jgi:thiamine-phosphate pyrophosphorylase
VDFAAAVLDGGATALQLRAKQVPGGWLLDTARDIVRRADGSGALLIVNDRADIARLAGAGGVHVGQDDLPPAAVRLILGDAAVVGLSTHTVAQVTAAVREPISYAAIGPVFGSATKETGHQPLGLQRVRHAAAIAAGRQIPLVAIGGITLERAVEVVDAGASSVAVISDLLRTGDPARRVRQYLEVLGRSRSGEPSGDPI